MMTHMHPAIASVTDRIRLRSKDTRATYLDMIGARRPDGFARMKMTEGNLAHASAGCAVMEKAELLGGGWPNIGIITSYNDMLSAHAPFEHYPDIIRKAARDAGAIAQVAGGVPAMCDGVTQGQEGMELSLFSRDVIAMASAIGLSHDVFDAALHLGVCDKIIPGLVIAALRFGWLPSVFVPAGPMPSGLPNPEKVRIRQLFAEGKVDREELLRAEAESYHTQGTCTFYGTANSNQMLMEVMGLHLPGAAFTNPGTPLREALTRAATHRAAAITAQGDDYRPMGELIDERSVVNGIVGLMATGGSTNHALHIPAMAAAAGILVTLEDFAEISAVTPLLARIYPNGWRPAPDERSAGPGRQQGFCSEARQSRSGSACDRVRDTRRAESGVRSRKAGSRLCRGGPVPGAGGQWHAGTARTDACAWHLAGQGVQNRTCHRWPHVRCERQDSICYPYEPRSGARRTLGAGPGRRPDRFRLRKRDARYQGGQRDLCLA